MQAASGSVNNLDRSEAMGTLLQELETSSTATSQPASIRSEAILPSSGVVEAATEIGSTKAASIISADHNASQTTIKKDIISPIPQAPPSQLPPPLPPKDVPITTDKGKTKEMKTTTSTSPPSAYPLAQTEVPRPTSSGLASGLASGINSAMRYVLNTDGTAPSRSASTSVPTPKQQQCHALLADVASIDERPHIKYDWTIGKRLKFSCTVYYAKQFDVLRKRCGISDTFLNSLSTSANWAAEGGKSKSNFWKTSDDRFIIKTLVNAWNVADLYVIVQLFSGDVANYFAGKFWRSSHLRTFGISTRLRARRPP
jgi:1-phosphatidylinositol-3-phosphate 5-kinase